MPLFFGPNKFQPSGHDPAQNLPFISVDDDASDGWWAGSQLAAIAVAVVVAGNALAAQAAQAVTTQDQGEIWAAVSRAGSGSSLSPVFIDSDAGRFLNPWTYEQNEEPPRPFEFEGYQPPRPWPEQAFPAFWGDAELPVAPIYAEADYQPPAPWAVAPQQLYLYVQDEPATTVALTVTEDEYQPPLPWTVSPQPLLWFATDDRPNPSSPLSVTEDQYQPPAPWAQAYVLRPMGGSGSRSDIVGIRGDEYAYDQPRAWETPAQPLVLWPQDEAPVSITPLLVTEDEYQSPAPWIVPPQALYGFANDDRPTPAAPLSVEETGYTPPQPWADWTFQLWLPDEAPPFTFTEDEWQPPRPWPILVRLPDPWWGGADDRPQPAAPLGVDADPWPLPPAWPATAHRALLWDQDEHPTFVAPVGLDVDPWPLPPPWPIVPSLSPIWPQDELSSLGALGQDAAAVEPVLGRWPYQVAPQPILGIDERPTPTPIAESTDELFPKVLVERRWVVPQPWEIEQHMLAFLSPHTPVFIRDRSGPRYIVEDHSATRYQNTDLSATRYEVGDS